MPQRASHLSWTVVYLLRRGAVRRDGWYVLWTDEAGARRRTYAGQSRKLAESLLARRRSDRNAARVLLVAGAILQALQLVF
jgi:hypothetical protein